MIMYDNTDCHAHKARLDTSAEFIYRAKRNIKTARLPRKLNTNTKTAIKHKNLFQGYGRHSNRLVATPTKGRQRHE